MTKQIPSGYKQTKVGIIPEDWEVVKLDQVFQKSFYGTSDSTNEAGKYPVLRMGNMQNGTLDLKDLVYINLEEKEFKKYQLKKGDILLNRTNSYELVGKISLFDLEGNYMSASYIVAYRPNLNVLNPIFINNLLNTVFFQEKIKTIATKGVSQANINPTSFKEIIKIPLPPLKEQEKIAEILTTWDDAIVKQEQLIEQKQVFKKGVMQQIFSQKLRFKDDNGNDYPAWQLQKLGNVLVKNSSKNKNNFWKLVQSVSNKHGFVNQSDLFEDRVIASENLSNYYVIKKGTFAYNPSRIDVGSLAYKADDSIAVISPLYISFTASSELHDSFLLSWFGSQPFLKQMNNAFEGSVRNTLNYESLKTMQIKIPTFNEQTKISDFLNSIDDEITKQTEILEQLKLQKQSLMQKLLTGQVRIVI